MAEQHPAPHRKEDLNVEGWRSDEKPEANGETAQAFACELIDERAALVAEPRFRVLLGAAADVNEVAKRKSQRE